MVHTIFDTNSIGYDDFIQWGNGLPIENIDKPQYEVYRGGTFQRGYGEMVQNGEGVGDVFRGIWRFFLPLIRRVGTAVSAEALNTGQRVLEKMNEGEPLKGALISEGKRGIDTVLDQGGFPKQFGSGKGKKRRRTNRRIIPSHQIIIGKTVPKSALPSPPKKRVRSDAFGLY